MSEQATPVPVIRYKNITTGRRSSFNTRNVSPIQYRGAKLGRPSKSDPKYTTPRNAGIGKVSVAATVTAPTCKTLGRAQNTRTLLAHCYDAVQLALSSVPTSYSVVIEPMLAEAPYVKMVGCETKPAMFGVAVARPFKSVNRAPVRPVIVWTAKYGEDTFMHRFEYTTK